MCLNCDTTKLAVSGFPDYPPSKLFRVDMIELWMNCALGFYSCYSCYSLKLRGLGPGPPVQPQPPAEKFTRYSVDSVAMFLQYAVSIPLQWQIGGLRVVLSCVISFVCVICVAWCQITEDRQKGTRQLRILWIKAGTITNRHGLHWTMWVKTSQPLRYKANQSEPPALRNNASEDCSFPLLWDKDCDGFYMSHHVLQSLEL